MLEPVARASLPAVTVAAVLCVAFVSGCPDTTGPRDAGPQDAPPPDANACEPRLQVDYAQSVAPYELMADPGPVVTRPESLTYLVSSGTAEFVAYDWGYPTFLGALVELHPDTGANQVFAMPGVATNLPVSAPDAVVATFPDGGAATMHWDTLAGSELRAWPADTFGGPLVDASHSTFASDGVRKRLWAFVDTAGVARDQSPPQRLHVLGTDGLDSLGPDGASLESWARPLASAWTRRATSALPDGGVWYVADGTSSTDPTFGLRAFKRDATGALVATSPSLADGAVQGLQSGEWPGATATYGEWARATSDGGLLVHFVTLRPILRSNVVRVSPDGSILWSVASAGSLAAALGGDYSDVSLAQVGDGVTAVIAPAGDRSRMSLWRVDADGTMPYGESGLPIYSTVMPESRDSLVGEVEVAPDGAGGVWVARTVGTGIDGALLLGRFAADGHESVPASVAPLTVAYDGGWLQMLSDGNGGVWVLLTSLAMRSELQHFDGAAAPLFWEHDETCGRPDGTWDYTLLRTYMRLPSGAMVVLRERDHV